MYTNNLFELSSRIYSCMPQSFIERGICIGYLDVLSNENDCHFLFDVIHTKIQSLSVFPSLFLTVINVPLSKSSPVLHCELERIENFIGSGRKMESKIEDHPCHSNLLLLLCSLTSSEWLEVLLDSQEEEELCIYWRHRALPIPVVTQSFPVPFSLLLTCSKSTSPNAAIFSLKRGSNLLVVRHTSRSGMRPAARR